MPTTTVNLGDEGLTNGDTIDGYLNDHFASGVKCVIPAGEYDWNGGGLGGSYSDAHLFGDPTNGEIIFNRPSDPENTCNPSTTATSGTVRFENFTFKNKAGEEQSRWRVGADAGATLEVVNVNKPDGTTELSDSIGFFSGPDHAGVLKFERCYLEDWGNLAMYIDAAGQPGGEDGQIIVEDCDFRNNNAAAVKFGSQDSIVRNCRIVNDAEAPSYFNGAVNQRGLRIDEAGDNMLVEDLDISHENGYGSIPIYLDTTGSQDSGGSDKHSGTIKNVRIYNDGSQDSIIEEWDTTGYWDGSDIHLTGPITEVHPEQFDPITGSGADEADNTLKPIWRPTADLYETREASGQTINVADGETLSNILFDMSTGESVTINATGTNWTIRNIGFKGKDMSGEGNNVFTLADSGGGTSTFENIYLGDGAAEGNTGSSTGNGTTGTRIDSTHTGHIEASNLHYAKLPDNAFHGSENYTGTVTVTDSYGHDNYASTWRGQNGTTFDNCTAYNQSNTGFNGRCAWVWRGTATVKNCNFDEGSYSGESIHVGRSDGTTTTLNLENTQHTGISETGTVTINDQGGNGNNPNLSIPSGVPEDAEQAASGGGATGGGSDDDPDNHLVITETAGGDLSYTFDVDGGPVEPAPESEGESNDTITDNGDGTYTVEGFTGNNYDDGYYYEGSITSMSFTGEYSLTLNGSSTTKSELVGDSTAPSISNYAAVQDGSTSDIIVSFDADEQVAKISVSVTGTTEDTLATADFTESGTGPYTYEATYTTPTDGQHTFTLDTAVDSAGNDGATGQQVTADTSTDSSGALTSDQKAEVQSMIDEAKATLRTERSALETELRDEIAAQTANMLTEDEIIDICITEEEFQNRNFDEKPVEDIVRQVLDQIGDGFEFQIQTS